MQNECGIGNAPLDRQSHEALSLNIDCSAGKPSNRRWGAKTRPPSLHCTKFTLPNATGPHRLQLPVRPLTRLGGCKLIHSRAVLRNCDQRWRDNRAGGARPKRENWLSGAYMDRARHPCDGCDTAACHWVEAPPCTFCRVGRALTQAQEALQQRIQKQHQNHSSLLRKTASKR